MICQGGQTVVQGGQMVVQPEMFEVVQGGQPFVHSRVSSTVNYRKTARCPICTFFVFLKKLSNCHLFFKSAPFFPPKSCQICTFFQHKMV